MSGKATGWVLQHGPRPDDLDHEWKPLGLSRARGWRAVLAVIADAANADGEHAHPGRQTIIDASLYSASTVDRVLGELTEAGWIEVEATGGGRGKATTYRIPGVTKPPQDREVTDRNLPNPDAKPPQSDAKPPRVDTDTLDVRAPNGLYNVENNARAVDHVDDGFELFWESYLRKVAKPTARKAWERALRRASAETILDGLDGWLSYWRQRGESQFVPYPATWLNRDGWADEPPRIDEGRLGKIELLNNLDENWQSR